MGHEVSLLESFGPRVAPRAGAWSGSRVAPAEPEFGESVRTAPRPLDPATRAGFESRFGYEFGQVRLHSDATAAESAHQLAARAFTRGSDVYFGAGQYAPETPSGRWLLAHELTHVVQQRHASPTGREAPSVPAHEAEADAVAAQFAGGQGRLLDQISDSGMQPRIALAPAATDPGASAPTLEDQKKSAHAAVVEFRKAGGPIAWKQLKVEAVAAALDSRIDNPDLIFQGPLNLCGATSIVYLLATTDPVTFVSMVRQLYETGTAKLNGETLTAGSDLRSNAPPPGMEPAEWMLMSAMQDSDNAILDYEGTSSVLEPLAGMAMPGEIVHFMKAVLKCKTVDWKHAYLSGELDVITQAGTAVTGGKRVILLVDADMLNPDADPWFGIPNHWIVLRSGVAFTEVNVEKEGKVVGGSGKRVQFDAWSWGKVYHIDLPQKVFIKTFFGAAIGSP